MTIASIFMSFFAGSAATDDYCPVTLAQAKAHLRVDSDDDDALIGDLINAAAMAIETETGVVCQARDVTVYHQRFAARMPLYYLPVNSVGSITYLDDAGDEQTLASDQYGLRYFAGEPVINPGFGVSYPATDTADGAVAITFNAGHASNDDIDSRIKQAALLMIGHWFANRESVGASMDEVPMSARYLLSGLRRTFVG